jgi:hypothetical protein
MALLSRPLSTINRYGKGLLSGTRWSESLRLPAFGVELVDAR